jgi:hypothetical protein
MQMVAAKFMFSQDQYTLGMLVVPILSLDIPVG